MKQIDATNHILIIHYSSLSRIIQLVRDLRDDSETRECPIVLIDNQLDTLPPELSELRVKFVRGNPTAYETLNRANFEAATHAIVLAQDPKNPRSDDLNLAVAMTLEGLKKDLHTVIECVEPRSIDTIRRTGCDSIVCASQFTTDLLVQELLDPGVRDVFAELGSVSYGQNIYAAGIENMGDWTYGELTAWLHERQALPLGLRRSGKVILNPDESYKVIAEDAAIFIGRKRLSSIATA